MKVTVLAWNSRRLLVRHLVVEGDRVKRELQEFAEVARLQRQLRHRGGDPRWQVVDGHLKVVATKAVRK